MHKPIHSEVFTVIIGFFAVLYAISGDVMSTRERVAFIVGITVLSAIQIHIIYRERERYDRESYDRRQEQLVHFKLTYKQMEAATKLLRAEPAQRLKRETIGLAGAMYAFLNHKLEFMPYMGSLWARTLAGDTNKETNVAMFARRIAIATHEKSALEKYREIYSPRVAELRSQLIIRGDITKESIERLNEEPTTLLSVGGIAETLMSIGDEISE